jgi:hypothetical protein
MVNGATIMGIYSFNDKIIKPDDYPYGEYIGWSPYSAGAKLWMDAYDNSSIELDGFGKVVKWYNKGINSYILKQEDFIRRPKYVKNNYIEFDGISDALDLESRLGLSANPDIVIVMLVNILDVSETNQALFHIGDNSSGGVLQACADADGWCWRHNNGNRIFNTVITNTDTIVAYSRSSGSTYGNSKIYVNGYSMTEVSTASPELLPTNDAELIVIGSGHDPYGDYIKSTNFRLKELILFQNQEDVNRQKAEGYLARKWGLVDNLDYSHPYKNIPPY